MPQRQTSARPFRRAASLFIIGAAAGLVACGPSDGDFPETHTGGRGKVDPSPTIGREANTGLFGERGLVLFGDGNEEAVAGQGIGVNAFLWRASLDTLAFMPLASADPFGGVIITDWYSDPAVPNERFKMTVYILDRRLRADGIRVAVFRQQKLVDGAWEDAQVNPDTAARLENAILSRAREMRIATLAED